MCPSSWSLALDSPFIRQSRGRCLSKIVEAGRIDDSDCGGRYREGVEGGGGVMVVCMAVPSGQQKNGGLED